MRGSRDRGDAAAVNAEAPLSRRKPARGNSARNGERRRRGEGFDRERHALRGLDRGRPGQRTERRRLARPTHVSAGFRHVVRREEVVALGATLRKVVVDVDRVRRARVESTYLPAERHDITLSVRRVAAIQVAELPGARRRRRRSVRTLRESRIPERGHCHDIPVSDVRTGVKVDVIKATEVAELVVELEVTVCVRDRGVVRRGRNRAVRAVPSHDRPVRELDDHVVTCVGIEAGARDVNDAERRIETGVGRNRCLTSQVGHRVRGHPGGPDRHENRNPETNDSGSCHVPRPR